MKASSSGTSSNASPSPVAITPDVQSRIDRIRSGEEIVAFNTLLEKQDVEALAKALSSNNTLKGLGLQNCGLTDDSLTIILTALKGNTTLKRLYLKHNKLTDIGAGELLHHMKQHESITHIAIGEAGSISNAMVKQLDEVEKKNFALIEQQKEAPHAAPLPQSARVAADPSSVLLALGTEAKDDAARPDLTPAEETAKWKNAYIASQKENHALITRIANMEKLLLKQKHNEEHPTSPRSPMDYARQSGRAANER